MDGPATGSRRGAELQDLGLIEDGAVAVRAGKILAVGKSSDLRSQYRAREELDLSGFIVMPGFVDCHTHPVFANTREEEFHMRCAGADYMEIAAGGGGILNSTEHLRACSEAELSEMVLHHLDGFLEYGTTTVEAKSGYGLSTESEVMSLKALTQASSEHPLTVSRTFLGAHEVPLEYRGRREAYVDLVVEEMLPAVKDLCESCDVFAEPKVFDRLQSLRILSAAQAQGLRLRVHADEIEPMAGAELAVQLGADSADHLPRISLSGQEALAGSDTTAVLLPGTSFYLGKSYHAPARSMIDQGCAVALATDFNPGSCYTQSMPMIITLACILLQMTPEECIHACTINPAKSLHLDDRVGSLHPGKSADLAVLDLPSYRALGYCFGSNPVVLTVKSGEPVFANVREREPDLFTGQEPGLPSTAKQS